MAGYVRCASPSRNLRFGMRADLAPRPRGARTAVKKVLYAVDTLHPPIEIPDSRFADFANAGEAQIIADNCCALLVRSRGSGQRGLACARPQVEERPIIALRGKQICRHGRNVLGIPASRWPGLPMNLRQLDLTTEGRGGGDHRQPATAAAGAVGRIGSKRISVVLGKASVGLE